MSCSLTPASQRNRLRASGRTSTRSSACGTRFLIRPRIQFSTAFYRAIGYGHDVLTAFNLGCSQLDLDRIDEAQKPRLLGKADPAGVKFEVQPPATKETREGKPTMSQTPWWEQLPAPAPKIETGKTQGDVIIG